MGFKTKHHANQKPRKRKAYKPERVTPEQMMETQRLLAVGFQERRMRSLERKAIQAKKREKCAPGPHHSHAQEKARRLRQMAKQAVFA